LSCHFSSITTQPYLFTGLSTASFVNEKATATVTVKSDSVCSPSKRIFAVVHNFLPPFFLLQKSDAAVFHSEAGFAWSFDSSTCVGFGASLCVDIAKSEGWVGPYFGTSGTYGHEHVGSDSATLTFSYEYTTSDDIEKAGNRSDMFLTPSLIIKFSKSGLISFSPTTCTVESKEISTWDINSPKNVQVCCTLPHFSFFGSDRVCCRHSHGAAWKISTRSSFHSLLRK
jgi:hypothetical protein